MANLLLVIALAITLLYGCHLMRRLDQFLNSGKIEREDIRAMSPIVCMPYFASFRAVPGPTCQKAVIG